MREDGKVHSVNLQHASVADGRSHAVIVRLSGLRGDTLAMELYVDCKQVDSSMGLPELMILPQAEVEAVEVRTGQKAYQRMQVSESWELWGCRSPALEVAGSHPVPQVPWSQDPRS